MDLAGLLARRSVSGVPITTVGFIKRMAQQAGPSTTGTTPESGVHLLHLPEGCLHHIVRSMDRETRWNFFCASKGSQDAPGCAILVLRACKTSCALEPSRRLRPGSAESKPLFMLYWAAQISTHMELALIECNPSVAWPVTELLHCLLVFPDENVAISSQVQRKPATYPGITKLEFHNCHPSSLIPELLAAAFPNLKDLCYAAPEQEMFGPSDRPLKPVLQHGLPSIQRLHLDWGADTVDSPVRQHMAEQLSYLTCLTSLHLPSGVLTAAPIAALLNLKHLGVDVYEAPTAQFKATLADLPQMESLRFYWHITHGPADSTVAWLTTLLPRMPNLRTLNAHLWLEDEHMPPLLALPHLTSLTVSGLSLSHDYSSASCSWKSLTISSVCTSEIINMPLDSLDTPVQCSTFSLSPSGDHAADIAAIRAAKPRLEARGDICRLAFRSFEFDIKWLPPMSKDEAEELLQEWAPCLPVPARVVCRGDGCTALIHDAVARLWPQAMLTGVS